MTTIRTMKLSLPQAPENSGQEDVLPGNPPVGVGPAKVTIAPLRRCHEEHRANRSAPPTTPLFLGRGQEFLLRKVFQRHQVPIGGAQEKDWMPLGCQEEAAAFTLRLPRLQEVLKT